MGLKPRPRTREQRAETLAREMSRDATGSEGLWEMFLLEAYMRVDLVTVRGL